MADPQKILLGDGTCEDLMQCMLNLGDLEIRILKRLLRKGSQKSEDLARHLRRDRSMVHRGLQRLMACGIIVREKRIIAKGGYYFVYSSIPVSRIRSKMKGCVDDMYENMTRLVEEFELLEKGKAKGKGKGRPKR